MSEMNNENKSKDCTKLSIVNIGMPLFKKLLAIVALTLLLYWCLDRTDVVRAVISKTLSVLSPFIIGFSIAFIINVLMRPMENLWDKLTKRAKGVWAEKVKRPLCLILSILLIVGIIFAIIFMVIPEVTRTFRLLIAMLPSNISNTQKWIDGIREWLISHGMPEQIEFDIMNIGQKIMDYITTYGYSVFDKTMVITTGIFSGVFTTVIAFVLSIYMLSQKETLCRQAKRLTFAVVPEEKANRLLHITKLTNKTFTSFVAGQLTEAVIIGVLCFIGMSIFKMPYAPVISTLVGFTALIPVFGAFIGTAIGAFLILLVSPAEAFWFIVFVIVLQQLEGNLIYPKVVGKSIGLPGIWVITAVTIGGSLFGFLGILICVPICSIIYTFVKEYVRNTLEKKKLDIK
ncbi:MAG: AI-2E family transporter [Eubacteriales bacterium]|nr:AI-2E family transporter [Eubacteriales bacterium]